MDAKLLNRNEITDVHIEDDEILIFRGLEPNPESINREDFEAWCQESSFLPIVRSWGEICQMPFEDFYLRPDLCYPALKAYPRPKPAIFSQNKFSKFQNSSL